MEVHISEARLELNLDQSADGEHKPELPTQAMKDDGRSAAVRQSVGANSKKRRSTEEADLSRKTPSTTQAQNLLLNLKQAGSSSINVHGSQESNAAHNQNRKGSQESMRYDGAGKLVS
jgi:hypothetical protein